MDFHTWIVQLSKGLSILMSYTINYPMDESTDCRLDFRFNSGESRIIVLTGSHILIHIYILASFDRETEREKPDVISKLDVLCCI